MTAIQDIRDIIEKIFAEEGLKKGFLEPSSVISSIASEYLSDEFREFDDFKSDEKGNILPPDSGKSGWEKTRRKTWTGKNVSDSLTKEQKETLRSLKLEAALAQSGGEIIKATDALAKSQKIIGMVPLKSQVDRFLKQSETPELNGFFNKPNIKDELPSYLLKYYYSRIQQDADLKRVLNFVLALFTQEKEPLSTTVNVADSYGGAVVMRPVNIASYVPYLTLHGIFGSYFESHLYDLPPVFDLTMEKYFKSIEVSKSRKGLYNDIGYLDPAQRRKEHITILSSLIRDSSPDAIFYYDSENLINTYVFESFQSILNNLDDTSFPLVNIFAGEIEEVTHYRKYFNHDFVNNLASTLARTYGDDEESRGLFTALLDSWGYEEEEIQRYLYLFVFPSLDFSKCSPEPELPVNLDPADCQDDFYDPLPADWTSMSPNNIFFDETACSYAISFVTEYENTTKVSLKDMKDQYRQQISRNMLVLLGKSDDADSMEEISSKLTFKSYFINPKPLLKMRLLAYLHKEDLDNIGDTTQGSRDNQTETISYNIDRFFRNIDTFSQIMKFYEQRMIIDMFRGNALQYSDVNFSKEAAEIEKFASNLSNLLRPIDIYDTLSISFVGNRIIAIDLTKAGYKKRNVTNGLVGFSTSSPQTRTRTISFIKSLQDIIDYYAENRNQQYDVFIEKFFDPVPGKTETQNTMLAYSQGSPQPIGFASMKDLSKRAGDFLASEVKRGFTSFSCLTEEERLRLEQEAADTEQQKKKETFGEQMKVQIEDSFFAQVPEIFEKISSGNGKEALNSLGSDFLNRLGVCGLGDLVALAATTMLSFMNPEEYMDELVKCAISKMDPETARKFYNKVSTSQVLEKLNDGTGFLDKYRSLVGDTLLPWDMIEPSQRGQQELSVNVLELFGAEDFNKYNLRIRAFGDSVVASFDTKELLGLLNDIPGGEWIKFFIELSDSIIRQCKIVNDGDGILTDINAGAETNDYCGGDKAKIKWPKFPKVRKVKGKNLADSIAENAQEMIIKLTVKLMTAAFRELMKNVTEALSFDANFVKNGPQTPQFLQDGRYFYDIVRESSKKAALTDAQINDLFLETLVGMQIEGISELTEKSVDNFLTNTSLVLNPKEKIDLLKGSATRSMREQILEANPSNGVARVMQKDPSKIADAFEKFGENINKVEQEEKLAADLENSQIRSDFCLEADINPYTDALKQKGATDDEIEEQRREKLEREKEKLCNLMDMMSNPIAPIFGNALTKLFKKDGPIFGLLEEEKYNIFKTYAEQELKLFAIPFSKDLDDPRDGFLQLILHGKKGFAYDRIDIKSDTPAFAYDKFKNSLGNTSGTRFNFNTELEKTAYSFQLSTSDEAGSRITLKEDENGINKVHIGDKLVSEYKKTFDISKYSEKEYDEFFLNGKYYVWVTDTETISFNQEASDLYKLLIKSIDVNSEDLDKESLASTIVRENMPHLVERYYGNVKREVLQSDSFSFEDWEILKSRFTDEKILKLFNIEDMLSKNLLFYQQLEPDDRMGKRKKLIYESPFDSVLSKEDYIRIAILTEMMIKTYTLEAIMKSFFAFRSFSEEFFPRADMISNYIITNMRKDLGKSYTLFAEKSLQIYLSKISLGLQEVVNEDAKQSYAVLTTNLESYRRNQRGDSSTFLSTNSKYIDDLLADYAESSIISTIRSFKGAFSSRNINMDQFILGPMLKDNPRDVVQNVTVSEPFDDIAGTNKLTYSATGKPTMTYFPSSDYKKTRIVMEKFICIEDRENVPSFLVSSVKGRPDWLSGITNLDAWRAYLIAHREEFAPYDINDLWKSWKFGLRLSYVMPNLISSDDVPLEERQNSKAYSVKFNSEEVSLVPLSTVMIDIENEKISSNILDDYDLSCLVYELAISPEYKKLFTDIVDIETLISLITIYSVDEYAYYLGEGTKKFSDLNKWQKKQESFLNTKDAIIDILKDF